MVFWEIPEIANRIFTAPSGLVGRASGRVDNLLFSLTLAPEIINLSR